MFTDFEFMKGRTGVFGPIFLWFGQHVLQSFSGADPRLSSKDETSNSQQPSSQAEILRLSYTASTTSFKPKIFGTADESGKDSSFEAQGIRRRKGSRNGSHRHDIHNNTTQREETKQEADN